MRELTSAVQLRKYQEELELEKAHHRQTQTMRGVLSQILDGLEAAIIGLNEKGEIVTWNATAERLFGYSANEAVGQPISFLFSPGIGPAELAVLEQISPGKKTEHQVTIPNRRDGSQTKVSLTISAIHDPTGKLKGASLIARPAQVLHS